MNQNVLPSELLSFLIVNALITKPDGTVLVLSNPVIKDTAYKFTTQVTSFGDNDVGNYTCNATIRPKSSAIYLTGISQLSSSPIEVVIIGKQNKFTVMHSDISKPYV